MSGSSLFTPTYYQISITNATGSAPADGFIDATPVATYLTGNNSDNLPGGYTLTNALAKRRANYRYKQVIQQLELMTNILVSNGQVFNIETGYTENPQDATIGTTFETNTSSSPAQMTYASIVATGAGYSSEASTFTFTITVERGDNTLVTPDETSPGNYLTGNAALIRCVARALIYDWIVTTDIFDPTKSNTLGTPGSTTPLPRQSSQIIALTVGHCIGTGSTANLAANLTAAAGLVTVTSVAAP